MGKGSSVGDWKAEPISGYCIFGDVKKIHNPHNVFSCWLLLLFELRALQSCCIHVTMSALDMLSPAPQVEAQLSYAFDQWGDAFYEEPVMLSWKGVMQCAKPIWTNGFNGHQWTSMDHRPWDHHEGNQEPGTKGTMSPSGGVGFGLEGSPGAHQWCKCLAAQSGPEVDLDSAVPRPTAVETCWN